MLNRFHSIPERNGQTDRQTDFYINIAHRVLTRDKELNRKSRTKTSQCTQRYSPPMPHSVCSL